MRTSGRARLSSAQGTVAVLLKWGSRGPVVLHTSHYTPRPPRNPTPQILASNSPVGRLAAMGLWNYARKGKHDREAGSSSGRRRGSVKEEAASPPHRASVPAPFTIVPRPADQRDRQYLSVEVCRRYWERRMPVPWSDVHLPNNWHLSIDRVPITLVPSSGRARRDEIERRRRLLPDDLYYDDTYAPHSVLWDT
ncbi:ADP-ribosylation factor-related protein 1 [Hordeum vulgare]|nr:ADP-ribosylation factor-related protein 1 [Hordeum vulgare]